MVFKVGIIGLGGMGKKMLSDMSRHQMFSVVTVWDPDNQKLATIEANDTNLHRATSANDLIFNNKIDLLYIASPPHHHREYLNSAIKAKTAVFCEKPLGVNISESKLLVAQIKNASLLNIMNFNHGNALSSSHVEKKVNSGQIGNVIGVDIFVHLNDWPREFQKTATWLSHREQGGFTREILSHWLYLTRRLFGAGFIINAHVTFPNDGISSETHLTALLDFGGVPVLIHATSGSVGPVGTEYTVWGSQESYRLRSGGGISVSDGREWVKEFSDIENSEVVDSKRSLDGVVSRLKGEDINMPNVEDGLAVQILVENLLAS
jgi:predicted dehydrogenase